MSGIVCVGSVVFVWYMMIYEYESSEIVTQDSEIVTQEEKKNKIKRKESIYMI